MEPGPKPMESFRWKEVNLTNIPSYTNRRITIYSCNMHMHISWEIMRIQPFSSLWSTKKLRCQVALVYTVSMQDHTVQPTRKLFPVTVPHTPFLSSQSN